jgi:hypothetical protein
MALSFNDVSSTETTQRRMAGSQMDDDELGKDLEGFRYTTAFAKG